MAEPDKNAKSGMLRRTIAVLCRPSAKYSLATLLVVGFLGGIAFWGAFNTALEATNRLEFCISCHEMRDTVYQEYKETIHYKNPVGVRAICSDCHVPKDWTHKMIRKMQATFEVWGKLTGSIDTPEKFEARRAVLAADEQARMRAADSRECRNCHSFEAMDIEKQQKLAQRRHTEAQLKESGKTCIDCHQGIAHHLPKAG